MAPGLFSDICWIIRVLKSQGYQAFLAGGAVRDLFLGIPPQDYDIATTATPEEILALFPRAKRVGKAFGTTLIVIEHRPYQVTTLQSAGGTFTNSLEKDILRRDFTVNALFWDPLEDRLIDIVGGMKDLKRRILVPVTSEEDILEDDPIRMLRTVRLSNSLHFKIPPSLLSTIRARRKDIHRISPERIHDELVKILSLDHDVLKASCLLATTRLLFELIPEIIPLRHLDQSPYHDFSGLSHSFRTLSYAESLYRTGVFLNREIPIKKHLLMLAALLHDIGKPSTRVWDGRANHFYQHENAGAEMAEKFLKRYRFPKREVQTVKFLIARHMYPLHLQRLKVKGSLTLRAVERFRRNTKGMSGALLLLATADQMAKRRNPTKASLSSWFEFCDMILGA